MTGFLLSVMSTRLHAFSMLFPFTPLRGGRGGQASVGSGLRAVRKQVPFTPCRGVQASGRTRYCMYAANWGQLGRAQRFFDA